MYQLTTTDMVLRLSDSAHIPPDPDNRDYAEYLDWLEAGNTPEPAPEPPKVYKQFTGMEKFELFSEDEQRAIAAASMTDIDVKLFYDKFMTVLYITYDNPLMEKGLRQLADGGLLTKDRYAEIVTKMTATD